MSSFRDKFNNLEKERKERLVKSIFRKTYTHLKRPQILIEADTYLIQRLNNEEGQRFYQLADDKKSLAISMTSIIAKYAKNKELANWKKFVGEKEAKQIASNAAFNGKIHHNICEHYLNSISEEKFIELFKDLDPIYITQFRKVHSALQDIDNILAVEQKLYSKEYLVAGTADIIADYENVLSVIDHKTSEKEKTKKYVKNYFLQKTGYCLMLEEMTGVYPKQIVAIITVAEYNDLKPQVFVENPDNYKDEVLSMFKKWKAENV